MQANHQHQLHLTAEQVKAEKYKEYSPLHNAFQWNKDGSCDVVPLAYWDDASYARYQCDCGD